MLETLSSCINDMAVCWSRLSVTWTRLLFVDVDRRDVSVLFSSLFLSTESAMTLMCFWRAGILQPVLVKSNSSSHLEDCHALGASVSHPLQRLSTISPESLCNCAFLGLKLRVHCSAVGPAHCRLAGSCLLESSSKGFVEQFPECNIFRIAIRGSVSPISRACLVSGITFRVNDMFVVNRIGISPTSCRPHSSGCFDASG